MHKVEEFLKSIQKYKPKLKTIDYSTKCTYEFVIDENISVHIFGSIKDKEITDIVEKYDGLNKYKFFQEISNGSRS